MHSDVMSVFTVNTLPGLQGARNKDMLNGKLEEQITYVFILHGALSENKREKHDSDGSSEIAFLRKLHWNFFLCFLGG